MDSTHQLIANPEPSPVVTPPNAAGNWPQEATGDSGSDVAVSVQAAYSSSENNDDDDAESCSGDGKGGYDDIDSFFKGDDSDKDDVTMEIDESEVDSKMSVPWWRRTHEYAANDDGGCAPAVAAEGGCHAAESNRLFWEACIAHGY